ncbi:MAG: zinc ABC transporter substrate-binding protein [Kiloniellales bacterium]
MVSIKPLHGLASALMEGVGEPSLLLDGTASPHGYSLRPSEARALSDAELIFWVGPTLETFLIQPLDSLAEKADVVTAGDLRGLVLLEAREGGLWEGHDHEAHAHEGHHDDDDHDEHGHEAHHDEEEHEEHADETHHDDDHDEHGDEAHHDEDEHEEHAHEAHHDDDHDEHGDEAHHDEDEHAAHEDETHIDPHIWLDPENAVLIANAMAAALVKADPENAARYQSNLAALESSLEDLDRELAASLAAVNQQPYIVFHDAYRYFEEHFGLSPVGSISVSPEQRPGARRIAEIRDLVQERGAVCIFSEPQFSPVVIESIAEGSDIGGGTLDPLGAAVDKGPGAYQEVMLSLARGLIDCFAVSE